VCAGVRGKRFLARPSYVACVLARRVGFHLSHSCVFYDWLLVFVNAVAVAAFKW